eukprot:4237715-Pleurochrysis_carterae.AAC.1
MGHERARPRRRGTRRTCPTLRAPGVWRRVLHAALPGAPPATCHFISSAAASASPAGPLSTAGAVDRSSAW